VTKISKRMKEVSSKVEKGKTYDLENAISLLKECTKVKFIETVELYFNLGVDPRKSDQMIRGVVDLPFGTGKTVKILVFAKELKAKEALDSGADWAGFEEYFEKVKEGWTDFDVVISVPDLMREVGKLGKVLGPKGLMPNPKSGTVTNEVRKAVEDIKKGKIEYRVDKNGNVAVGIGKLSFEKEKILENARCVIKAVIKSKPIGFKGDYLKNIALSSTMGPGLKINLKPFLTED
jgi:large subunit ribosomal protein L1